MKSRWWARLGCVGLWVSFPALGGGLSRAAAGGGQSAPVQLVQRPKYLVGTDEVDVAMFPRVLPGPAVSAAVADRINRSLDRFNAQVLRDVATCSKAEKALGPDHAPDYSRSLEVTMQGPRFLSFVAEDGFSCGGPHPMDGELALVYDLTTGLPVDWTRLLPKGVVGKVYRSEGHLPIGLVVWPLIMKKVRTHPAAGGNSAEDCASSYEDGNTPLNVWLDVAKHAVVFSPQLGSHYDTAMCSQQLEVRAEEATGLGIAAEVVAAIR